MRKLQYTALIAAALIFGLVGCATSGDYKTYVQAQADANRLAAQTQKPLVRLTAQTGQPITGLASLEVYAPTAAPVVQQSRPSEWAGVLGQAVGVAGTVLGIHEAGKAAIGLSDSVGRAGTTGYQYIQTPQANVTTTNTDASNRSTTTLNSTTSTVGDNSGANSGNAGRIAGADLIDNTATPTVVTQPAPVVVQPLTP